MHNSYIVDSEQYLSEEGLARGSKLLQQGNLLLLVRGSMLWKHIPICYNKLDVAFNQDVKGIITNKFSRPLFLLYWFESHESRMKYMVTGTGIGAGKLDTGNLLSMNVSLPSLKEQERIISLLQLLDERIATQNKIIEKLESLIRGIYKTLLGESDQYRYLDELCEIKKGVQVNKEKLSEKGLYYVMNGGITPSGYYDLYNTEANTISISEGGNSCGYVQYNYTPFWSGGHCYTLENISNVVDNRYLFHYLKANELQIMSLRIGSGLPNIQKKDLSAFRIPLPALNKQINIAKALDALLYKITVDKNIYSTYKQQKEYLLQQMFI